MSVELRPLGVKCNIHCHYCYQNPQRDSGAVLHRYDIDKMKEGIERAGGPFTLFGGEPLLIPLDDLERIWSWGFERYGRNSVQTNGSLITDKHVELFRRYRVGVGISIDGPGELNDIRWAGTLDLTRKATAATEAAIARLCAAGMHPSLIVTLHRGNASPEKLPLLVAWLRSLDTLGVRSARFHLLEIDAPLVREKYALSTAENCAALLELAALEPALKSLRLPLFNDMRKLLRGDDRKASCIWNGCDPYTTRAVQGVEGNGQRSNCGRTNKDGIDFIKGDTPGFERYLALYHTPQELGGCSGCRFFSMCKGQCPGTAIDGDWRNRSEHCEIWKSLFTHFETEMVAAGRWTLSRSISRAKVEAALLEGWRAGRPLRIADALERLRDPKSARTGGGASAPEEAPANG